MKKILAILILITLAACEHTSVRQHPSFANSWGKQYSVVMVPPESKITYVQFDSDNRRLSEDEAKANNVIKSEVPKIFQDKGYKFINVNFEDYYAEYPNLKFDLEKLRTASSEALDDMYKNPQLEPKVAFNFQKSVGPLANIFADASGADLVLLINYEGFEKSDGMVAKDIAASVLVGVLTGMVPIQPTEAGGLEAILIDGSSGDILWTNVGATTYPLNKYDPSTAQESGLFVKTRAMTPLGVVFEALPDKTKSKAAD